MAPGQRRSDVATGHGDRTPGLEDSEPTGPLAPSGQENPTQRPLIPEGPAETPLSNLAVLDPIVDSYSRKDWKHWTDEDHDCQDTRQEVLIEESEVPVTFETERGCKVLTGRWRCPYTGEVFANPRRLDVDHRIPLGAANASGGHAWNAGRKRAFANALDVEHHLIAVKASANRSKGKRGPGSMVRRRMMSIWIGLFTVYYSKMR